MSEKPAATGTHTTAAIASGNVEESARVATADAAEMARTLARKTRRMRWMRGSAWAVSGTLTANASRPRVSQGVAAMRQPERRVMSAIDALVTSAMRSGDMCAP